VFPGSGGTGRILACRQHALDDWQRKRQRLAGTGAGTAQNVLA